MTMKLTIGTAAFDDFNGVFFTLETLRSFHDLPRFQAEIVVVDNHPDGPDAEDVRHYVSSINEVPARYLPFPEPVGTSAPRDFIFSVAQGEIVLVLDCHVVLQRRALDAILDFFADHPEPAIVSGPLLTYDRRGLMTHLEMKWRAGMWGIWAHDQRANDPTAPAFAIPAMGLGLFACRRSQWPGFHPLARGFGGEECYIHEKIRQRGGQAWCLPAVRWVHRFHNQSKPTAYPNTWEDRIRNYCLEFLELGRDLGEIRDHFVRDLKVLTDSQFDDMARKVQAEWEAYLASASAPQPTTTPWMPPMPDSPLGTTTAPTGKQAGCGCKEPRAHFSTVQQWLEYERSRSTLGKDAIDAIASAVRNCEVIADLGACSASAAACLANAPKKYFAVAESDPRWWWPQAAATRGDTEIAYLKADPLRVNVPGCDCLVIGSGVVKKANQLIHLLSAYHPARRVIVFGTARFGEFGEGQNVPGLRPGLRRFVRENAGWVVVRMSDNQEAGGGFAVLSCDPADRRALPGTFRQVANFARAVAQHVLSGTGKVSREVLEERLSICALCDRRTVDSEGRDRCGECGCYLVGGIAGAGGKAEWSSQDCPLGKWPSPDSPGRGSDERSVSGIGV